MKCQYLGYLSVRRYNSVNSFSIAHPVVFQMPLFMPHGMCRVQAAVLCALIALVSSCCWSYETWGHEVVYVEKGLYLMDASSSWLIRNQRLCSTVAWRYSFNPVDSENIIDVYLSCKKRY